MENLDSLYAEDEAVRVALAHAERRRNNEPEIARLKARKRQIVERITAENLRRKMRR